MGNEGKDSIALRIVFVTLRKRLKEVRGGLLSTGNSMTYIDWGKRGLMVGYKEVYRYIQPLTTG